MKNKTIKSGLSIFFMCAFLTNLVFAQTLDNYSLRKLATDESETHRVALSNSAAAGTPAEGSGVGRRGFLGTIGAGLLGGVLADSAKAQQRTQALTVGQRLKKTFERIKDKNGKVSSYSWNIAELTEENVRTLGAAGFNEIIIDGYGLLPGNRPPAFNIAEFRSAIVEAANQGIRIKFTLGNPSWAYGGAPAAKEVTATLCALLSKMKESLLRTHNNRVANVIEGLVVDMEPYGDPQWKNEGRIHDLSGYVQVHDELGRIAKASGLTYERAEAFWFGQRQLEDGDILHGYRPPETGRIYIMSYRNTGPATVSVGKDLGRRNEHLLGFDMATGGVTGFKGNLQNLPGAIEEAANTSLKDRAAFRGIFVHSGTLGELVREIKRWHRTRAEDQEPEETTEPDKEPAALIKGKASIRARVMNRSPDTTVFRVNVVLPRGASRQNLRVVAMKKTDMWYRQAVEPIPPRGDVVIPILRRRFIGEVKFFVVDITKSGEIPAQMRDLSILEKAEVAHTTEDFQAQVPMPPTPYSPFHLRPLPITPLTPDQLQMASLSDPFGEGAVSTGGSILAASVAVVASATLEDRQLTRRDLLKGAVAGTSAVVLAGSGQAVTAAESEQAQAKPVQIKTAAEGLRVALDRIKKEVPDGKATSYSWKIEELTAENVRLLGEAGFNEIVIDGYRLMRGHANEDTVRKAIVEARKAGISIKFTMGEASWAYEQAEYAKRTTTELCEYIDELKKSLAKSDNEDEQQAADVIKGIVIDIEPYTSAKWEFDLAPYVKIHNELEQIASDYKLTYERCEAFWFYQTRTEQGRRLTNYQFPKKGRSYIMSYRDSGSGTVGVSRGLGEKGEHLIGFDMATGAPTGFISRFGKLPAAIAETANEALAGRKKTFRGIFVHSSSLQQLVDEIKGWRQTAVKPGEFPSEATQGRVAVPQPEAEPEMKVVPGAKPGLAVKVIKKDAETTRFQVAITLPPEIKRENVMLLAFKKTDIWYLQETFENIPENGIITVDILKRGFEGQVKFILVDKEKYEKLNKEAKKGILPSLAPLRRAILYQAIEDLRAGIPRQIIPPRSLENPTLPDFLQAASALIAGDYEDGVAAIALFASQANARELLSQVDANITANPRLEIATLMAVDHLNVTRLTLGKHGLDDTTVSMNRGAKSVLGGLSAAVASSMGVGQSI